MQQDPQSPPVERIRRARREDIPALLHMVGGPEPGRVRALRRLTKTLDADLYVLDRDAAVQGVVAVVYRRSLTHGGLTATIDALAAWTAADAGDRQRDAVALLSCAISRARRRGCVAIDTALHADQVHTALEAEGFTSGASQLVLSLRDGAALAAGNPS